MLSSKECDNASIMFESIWEKKFSDMYKLGFRCKIQTELWKFLKATVLKNENLKKLNYTFINARDFVLKVDKSG